MKVAVIKLGARITWETDAAVGPGEAISICKALTEGGAAVHVFTKIIKKDTLDPSITWHNIGEDQDTSACDALVVINGNVNFFGGAEDREQILNYHLINHFKGQVFYVMCDPELPLQQIWESVSKKPWGGKYNEADLNITRNDLVLLAQPADLEHVAQHWQKKRGVPVKKIVHFPFERFPLLNQHLTPNENPAVDLLYGGTTRGGRRVPNIFKWYFGHPDTLNVEVFGKIDLGDFTKNPKVGDKALAVRAPIFTGTVKYSQVLPKMNNSLAHLVTGDQSYEENNIIPQRTYECMAAGNVVFIDSKMDKMRRIYPDPDLIDFLYVDTREQLSDRLLAFKTGDQYDHLMIEEIVAAQRLVTNFDRTEYCKSLVQTLKGT